MFTTLLNTSVAVSRKINIGNNVLPNYSEVSIGTIIMCADQLSANEIVKDGNNKILADYKFYADYSPAVIEGDYLAIESEKFKVFRVHNPNKMNRHIEIYALRIAW